MRDVMSRTRRVFGQCTTARPTWRIFIVEKYELTEAKQAETSRQLMVLCVERAAGGVVEWRCAGGLRNCLFVRPGSVPFCGAR